MLLLRVSGDVTDTREETNNRSVTSVCFFISTTHNVLASAFYPNPGALPSILCQAENGETELARQLFERLLERTQHVKVRALLALACCAAALLYKYGWCRYQWLGLDRTSLLLPIQSCFTTRCVQVRR